MKKLNTIKCPHCGTKYLAGEIYIPQNFIGRPYEVYKDDKGEIVKDYSEFDTLVTNVKELLDSVQGIPGINIRQATRDNLEQINRMYDECRYSMRTLQWIKEDLLKEENKDA